MTEKEWCLEEKKKTKKKKKERRSDYLCYQKEGYWETGKGGGLAKRSGDSRLGRKPGNNAAEAPVKEVRIALAFAGKNIVIFQPLQEKGRGEKANTAYWVRRGQGKKGKGPQAPKGILLLLGRGGRFQGLRSQSGKKDGNPDRIAPVSPKEKQRPLWALG